MIYKELDIVYRLIGKLVVSAFFFGAARPWLPWWCQRGQIELKSFLFWHVPVDDSWKSSRSKNQQFWKSFGREIHKKLLLMWKISNYWKKANFLQKLALKSNIWHLCTQKVDFHKVKHVWRSKSASKASETSSFLSRAASPPCPYHVKLT